MSENYKQLLHDITKQPDQKLACRSIIQQLKFRNTSSVANEHVETKPCIPLLTQSLKTQLFVVPAVQHHHKASFTFLSPGKKRSKRRVSLSVWLCAEKDDKPSFICYVNPLWANVIFTAKIIFCNSFKLVFAT